MTLMTHIPLADGKWDSISDLAVMLAIIVIASIGGIVKKIQESQAEKRAKEAEHGPGERADEGLQRRERQEPAKVHSAGEALQLLRQRRNRATQRREQRSLYGHHGPPLASAPAQQSQPLVDLQEILPPPLQDDQAIQAARRRRRAHAEAQQMKTRSQRHLSTTVALSSAAGPTAAEKTCCVDLHDPDALRRAIIYHEIFSAPKALREEPEAWDV